ncbi:hypothetical protein AGIG_G18316 [Arapaima gigas]
MMDNCCRGGPGGGSNSTTATVPDVPSACTAPPIPDQSSSSSELHRTELRGNVGLICSAKDPVVTPTVLLVLQIAQKHSQPL